MAIINSMAIGKARKSAGNITFATVKGRTIAREKPAYVKNPQTPAQVAQRAKMAKVVAAWRKVGNSIGHLFTVIPGYGSPYNQFVKMNIDKANGIVVNPVNGVITFPAGLSVGNGKYPASAVVLQKNVDNEWQPVVRDTQLKSEAQIGDVIGLFTIDNGTNGISNSKFVLTEQNIAQFKVDGKADVADSGGATSLMCAYFFSPSKNVSTSSVLESKE